MTLPRKKMTGLLVTKRKIANLLNDYFVHIAGSMPEIRVEDYGGDYANHLSIKAIHEQGRYRSSLLQFSSRMRK